MGRVKESQGEDLFTVAARTPWRFGGETYNPEYDRARLSGQLLAIFDLMQDWQYRTLDEINKATGVPQASASARLRDFRKPRFGAFVVDKRPRGDRAHGLWEYRLTPQACPPVIHPHKA